MEERKRGDSLPVDPLLEQISAGKRVGQDSAGSGEWGTLLLLQGELQVLQMLQVLLEGVL